jgi:hypothetical protein
LERGGSLLVLSRHLAKIHEEQMNPSVFFREHPPPDLFLTTRYNRENTEKIADSPVTL